MIAKTYSIAQYGIHGQLIEIEVDRSNGLPGITIVGLADKAVDEARERIRGAIKNSGFVLPPKRFTVNLIPADLPKKGSIYDLPIALAILKVTGQIQNDFEDIVVVGELGLNGEIKPTTAALIAAEVTRATKKKILIVPEKNAQAAALIRGISVYGATDLTELLMHLRGEKKLYPQPPTTQSSSHSDTNASVDMADIYGQESAKRAMMIAAAGQHNILLSGPPGSGKTMLARAAVGLLPDLAIDEAIEISKIHHLTSSSTEIISTRPFRAPHHTASNIAIIGGGQWPKPGEISLAHGGILFLDEIPEFGRNVLEVLRQPLEEGFVNIARANGHYDFPAQFMLVAAQNPCPCGYAGDEAQTCTCSLAQIQKYNTKISGPLLDRIDMVVVVTRPKTQSILTHQKGRTSREMKASIVKARNIQTQRFENTRRVNSTMTNKQIKQYCKLDHTTEKLAERAISELKLTARSYYRVLKIARTIADLDETENISIKHLTEALAYRMSPAKS